MLQTASISLDQYEQRVLARNIVNSIIDDFCGLIPDWSFLQRPCEILTEADETEYACPHDFVRIVPGSLVIGSTPIQLVYPEDQNRWNRTTETNDTIAASTNRVVATIAHRTQTPFYNVGMVFMVDGSSAVAGYGTGFMPEAVGRFFRTGRDSELYRIKAFQNQTSLTLDQPFRGPSIRGRVSVTSDNDKRIIGAPFLTRFDIEMIGRMITIENDTDSRIIVDVDPLSQIITLDPSLPGVDAGALGTELQYSIQDDYEIDPRGSWIMSFKNYTMTDDEVIRFTYYSRPSAAMDWYQELDIPREYHHVIELGSIAEFLSSTGRNTRAISRYDKRYEIEKFRAVNTEDPLNNTGRTISLGDVT